jgi:hypothetical protein
VAQRRQVPGAAIAHRQQVSVYRVGHPQRGLAGLRHGGQYGPDHGFDTSKGGWVTRLMGTTYLARPDVCFCVCDAGDDQDLIVEGDYYPPPGVEPHYFSARWSWKDDQELNASLTIEAQCFEAASGADSDNLWLRPEEGPPVKARLRDYQVEWKHLWVGSHHVHLPLLARLSPAHVKLNIIVAWIYHLVSRVYPQGHEVDRAWGYLSHTELDEKGQPLFCPEYPDADPSKAKPMPLESSSSSESQEDLDTSSSDLSDQDQDDSTSSSGEEVTAAEPKRVHRSPEQERGAKRKRPTD